MAQGRLGELARRSPPRVRNLLNRGRNRVLRALDAVPAGPPVPDAAEPVWKPPPVPVPDGMTLADLTKLFHTWSVNGEPAGHLDAYVADSLWRFCHTWSLIRDEKGRCLELGANPYFTTQLLDDFTDLDLTLVNFYGTRGAATETVSYVRPGTDEKALREHDTMMFNVEEDEFPFADHSFDVVLFCEIIEHLLMDPLAALREIHRVLEPGGILVLTTPNVARLDNVAAMVDGRNLYDPYSGFGPYGRHNREYTLHDLSRLLAFAGFEVEVAFTADGHPLDPAHSGRYAEVGPLVAWRSRDLGQYLFVRARVTGSGRDGQPSFLYRDWGAGQIVDYG